VFLSTVFSDLYPESHWKYVVWSGSLLAASATAYLRYKSGMHYPSDLIAGAIVGSAIGYLVPVLHRNKESDVSNSHASSTPLAFNLKMNF
jgi:membrane-associated phospholipid phosphatase